jgi:hypothetical protein
LLQRPSANVVLPVVRGKKASLSRPQTQPRLSRPLKGARFRCLKAASLATRCGVILRSFVKLSYLLEARNPEIWRDA